jgi:hypothetical protein
MKQLTAKTNLTQNNFHSTCSIMATIKAPKIQKAQIQQRREKMMLILLWVDALAKTKNPKPKLKRKLIQRNISTSPILDISFQLK